LEAIAMAKLLGINTDEDFCEHCGKNNLKRVVWIELDDGTIQHVGCDCAYAILTGKAKNRKEGTRIYDVLLWVEYARKLAKKFSPAEAEARMAARSGRMIKIIDGKIIFVNEPQNSLFRVFDINRRR